MHKNGKKLKKRIYQKELSGDYDHIAVITKKLAILLCDIWARFTASPVGTVEGRSIQVGPGYRRKLADC